MPRNMSFAMTTEQVRNQTKTVTRRLGWAFLRPGDLVQPIVKGQGLKKGETVTKIGPPIRCVSQRPETLVVIAHYGTQDGSSEMAREGFPDMSAAEFIEMFCRANRCPEHQIVNRIQFEYTAEPGEE